MQVTFLEATNGIALSKKHSIKNGFTPYPHVKKVSSHEHVIPNDSAGLAMLERPRQYWSLHDERQTKTQNRK